MRKMSDSAARGETTFVGVCTRLSTVRKQDMSDLPETHRAFLELELPPGYVHLVIWADHGVAYRGVGIPDGATQRPGR
jgi:hypothetical protein